MHVLAWFNASIFTSRHLLQINMQDININKHKKLKDLGVNKLQVCKMVVWQFKVNLGYANISVLNPNELYPLAVKHKIDKINNEDQKKLGYTVCRRFDEKAVPHLSLAFVTLVLLVIIIYLLYMSHKLRRS